MFKAMLHISKYMCVAYVLFVYFYHFFFKGHIRVNNGWVPEVVYHSLRNQGTNPTVHPNLISIV